MNQFIDGLQLSGRLGVYDFRRWHDSNRPLPNVDDQHDDFKNGTTAYGATLTAQTGAVYGFSGGFGIAFSSPFYARDNQNGVLVGPNNSSLHAITEGYLQYNYPGVRVRLGRQLIHTPVASTDYFTFLPRAFDGGSIAIRPLDLISHMHEMMEGNKKGLSTVPSQVTQSRKTRSTNRRVTPLNYDNDPYYSFSFDADTDDRPAWQVYVARFTRYESRFNDRFTTDNRYVQNTPGLLIAGSTIHQNTPGGDYLGKVYHYTFYDTGQLEFVEAGYEAPTLLANTAFGGFEPYVRAQYMHEDDTGAAKLGPIDADAYLGKIGVQTHYVGASVLGHYSPIHRGTFRNGQIAHPYTDLSGVFYTDTLNDGVGDLGPGWGLGGRIDITPSDNLSFFTRYVHYVERFGNSHAFYAYNGPLGFQAGVPITRDQKSWGWDTGVSFDLGAITPQLSGLTIGDVLGITDFEGSDRFYDNRLRLYYAF